MYRTLGLQFLVGFLCLTALFGGSIVSIVERSVRRECPNFLWRASGALVASIVALALAGLLIAVLPVRMKHTGAAVTLSVLFVFGIYWTIRAKTWLALTRASAGELILFATYALFSGCCLWLALADPTMPKVLPDGAYVSKELTRGVKIQYLTGSLPADNALPLVVAEYFLEDVSFRANHPIMPGQEVSNRPVLAAAAVTPALALLDRPVSNEKLPTFKYVGSDWPDFRILVRDDRAFAVYLAIMIPLNAAILLGAATFFSSLVRLETGVVVAAVALFVTSPYFIFQTIFTWPKELAAFFVLLAMAVAPLGSALAAGILTGLGYLSHPYAGAFLAGLSLYYLANRRKAGALRHIVLLVIGFGLTDLPWMLWVRHLNLQSDLVTQNLFVPGQRLTDFVWIRLVNLLTSVLPVHLLSYPFELAKVLIGSTLNIAGAMGLIISCICLIHLRDVERTPGGRTGMLMTLVPSLVLISVFSKPNVPAVHGLQVVVPLLIFAAASQMQNYHPAWRATLFGAQTLVNVVLLVLYLGSIGVLKNIPTLLP